MNVPGFLRIEFHVLVRLGSRDYNYTKLTSIGAVPEILESGNVAYHLITLSILDLRSMITLSIQDR